MKVRYRSSAGAAALALVSVGLLQSSGAASADRPNDFPTLARVQYVQECMNRNGGEQQYLYKCSCAIDKLAQKFTYDDFVEAATFANNAALAGERGGEFRDPDRAKQLTKLYRDSEKEAFRACGIREKE
jgi:hypothetical protein